MAQETKRGCGYRKVGAMYLVGSYTGVECDRLPYALLSCPTCGAGVKFTRSLTEINPLSLFGNHDKQVPVFQDNRDVAGHVTELVCTDRHRPCYLCDPSNGLAYVMMVGASHYPTPRHFIEEARTQGISKRIPFIPRKMVLGKTVLYLAHNKACMVEEAVEGQEELPLDGEPQDQQGTLVDDNHKHHLGIFTAFIPQRIEKLVWESELTSDSRKKMEKQGITPVVIKDGDLDHS